MRVANRPKFGIGAGLHTASPRADDVCSNVCTLYVGGTVAIPVIIAAVVNAATEADTHDHLQVGSGLVGGTGRLVCEPPAHDDIA